MELVTVAAGGDGAVENNDIAARDAGGDAVGSCRCGGGGEKYLSTLVRWVQPVSYKRESVYASCCSADICPHTLVG